uniref:La-related protein 6 n=1 Tax=Phallusia mammillata TaxID=59560 RepID=A0A6F9DIV7_9ASCI|nr:la-related protein 6 [Phallusia mammillata]
MQTAYPQHFICNVTSGDHYVTGVPPAVMTSYPPMEYGVSPALLQDVTQQNAMMPVFVKVGENLVLSQGNPHMLPQFAPTPGVQPIQYVTMPSTLAPLSAFPPPPVKPNSDPACQLEHLQGRHLAMSEVNQMLPPVEMRSILIPRRRSGQRGGGATCERILRGNNVAVRRTSQSFDDDQQSLGTPSPIKKPAPFYCDVINNPPTSSSPDARTLQKISDVLEYYFSDDCLSKNAYLLKQISQQENGFVSLRRIAALKRIKSLTRDIRTVAHCARQSRKLEMSEDGTMIRRVQPLPNNMEPPRFIRTVIAINLPLENPTIESVTSLFASFGDLTQVRVLKPGKPLPSYLRDYTAWVPDLGQNPCAMVEFESQDEAQRACREINMNHRKFNSLRVALLKPGARLRRTLYRKYKGMEVLFIVYLCSVSCPAYVFRAITIYYDYSHNQFILKVTVISVLALNQVVGNPWYAYIQFV